MNRRFSNGRETAAPEHALGTIAVNAYHPKKKGSIIYPVLVPGMLSKTRSVLIVVIVLVVVSGLLLMTSHPGAPAMNEKIEITRTLVGDWTGPSIQYGMSGLVTVHNIGSVAVEIATITVQKVAYSYSHTSAPGKFSAPSNQIAPGQSVTFKITCDPTTPIIVSESANVNWIVVTQYGAEATFRQSEF